MGLISSEVSRKVTDYEAQDPSNASWGHVKAAIVRYKMLGSTLEDAAKGISLPTPQNTTNAA